MKKKTKQPTSTLDRVIAAVGRHPDNVLLFGPFVCALYAALTPSECASLSTPEMRAKNRTLNKAQVARFARIGDELAALKTPALSVVQFGTGDGALVLADGQHRLVSGAEGRGLVGVLIQCDVDPEWFSRADQARRRTLAEALTLDGFKNTSTLAAALTYYNEVILDRQPLTNTEGVALARELKLRGLCDRVADAKGRTTFAQPVPPAALAFLSFVFCELDELAGRAFFSVMRTGATHSEQYPVTGDHPFNLLFAKLMNGRPVAGDDKTLAQRRLYKPTLIIRECIRAWNMAMRGEFHVGKVWRPAKEDSKTPKPLGPVATRKAA